MAEDAYSFQHASCGVALVICNENFQDKTKKAQRPGATKDLELLTDTFTSLGFNVRLFKDLTSTQMIEEAEKVAGEDHGDHDCVVVAVSSHGSYREVLTEENYGMPDVAFWETLDLLYGTDATFEVERLIEVFSETNSPSLKDKPKLFFFQGCRGGQFAETVTISLQGEMTQPAAAGNTSAAVHDVLHTLDATHVITIPSQPATCRDIGKNKLTAGGDDSESDLLSEHDVPEAEQDPVGGPWIPRDRVVSKKVIISSDFLTMWSCPSGYSAFHTNEGSPFIRILCEVLLAQHHEDDLLTMLTEVNRRVTTEYESHTEEEYSNKRRIVTSIEHMLRKQVYLC